MRLGDILYNDCEFQNLKFGRVLEPLEKLIAHILQEKNLTLRDGSAFEKQYMEVTKEAFLTRRKKRIIESSTLGTDASTG